MATCQELKIYRNEENCLGVGSYGAVYRAKRDELPCAAKFLHPTLFPNQGGSNRAIKRFQQECAFLSKLQHPNIVQYLGTYQDKQSGLTVLLTEILDENLTSFLKRNAVIPHHIQVDICHDVALGITYLHSNEIMHRDLSSNNILMVGNRRVKVSDFGMSKMTRTPSTPQKPMTYCPGTEVYMPPEAFTQPPQYTDRLDCFSLGVLTVQVLTGLHPHPAPRVKEVPCKDSPTGKIEMPILEIERRRSHIALVQATNPLLAIAKQCLRQSNNERPSAQQTCSMLESLKMEELYQRESKATHVMNEEDKLPHKGQLGIQSLTKENQHLKEELDTLQTKLSHKEETEIPMLISEIERLRQALDHCDKQKTELLVLFEQAEAENTRLKKHIATSTHLQVSVQKKEKSPVKKPSTVLHFNWSNRNNLPLTLTSSSHSTSCDTLYILDSKSNKLYAYEINTGIWISNLPECPYQGSTLTCVRDVVTAVGGMLNKQCSDKLLSLVGVKGRKRWVQYYPPMFTKRNHPITNSMQTKVIVAGGTNQQGIPVDTVEVLNTDTNLWSKVTPLPFPIAKGSAVICKDMFHIAVYQGEKLQPEKAVLACNVNELTTSTYQLWVATADLPAFFCTILSVHGHLLGIGGTAVAKLRELYCYNATQDKWTVVSHMTTPRSSCHRLWSA